MSFRAVSPTSKTAAAIQQQKKTPPAPYHKMYFWYGDMSGGDVHGGTCLGDMSGGEMFRGRCPYVGLYRSKLHIW